MQLSNFTLVVAIEVFAVLIVVSALLLFHARKQRQLIRRQQEKLQNLISELKRLKLPASIITGNTYKTHISSQLAATRNRYSGLQPSGDISTIQPPDSSPAHQALALRYQYLLTEESAIGKGDGPLQIDWQAFEDALAKLVTSGAPDTTNEELATYKKRVENLEKFKQLFFDMEQQWQDAQKQAHEYYLQLSGMIDGVENKDLFTDVLDAYHKVYSDIDQGFESGRAYTSSNQHPQIETKTVSITRVDPKSSEEIIKLRNVAADQHRIINQLQRKLEAAVTAEAKEEVIKELQQQLQRQVRFVQESETCIQLLEDELSAATEKVNKQQQQLLDANETLKENTRIKEALTSFALESKDLMKSIVDIEKENDLLKSKLQHQMSASAPSDQLEALKTAEAELLALKNQYVELEEKYLDLKLKG